MRTKSKPGSAEHVDPDDAPTLTKDMLADAEWFEGNRFIKRGDSRASADDGSEQVSFRLDQDVLGKLRAAGPGWQARVNAILRRALGLDPGRPAPTAAMPEAQQSRRRKA